MMIKNKCQTYNYREIVGLGILISKCFYNNDIEIDYEELYNLDNELNLNREIKFFKLFHI